MRFWFTRQPPEDPIARVGRMLDAAKSRNLATIAWTDPDLGEIRSAFYQAQPALPEHPAVNELTPEEMVQRTVRIMAPGFQGVPLPKQPRRPPGLPPDGSGLDT